MPVSRGGGFSGGGTRGSFSSSGGTSTPPTHISRKAFPGATRYVFINRYGHSSYFYSAVPPKRKSIAGIICIAAIIFAALAVVCTMLIFSSFPTKLGKSDCKPLGTYFYDIAEIIDDRESFNTKMKSFYEKTGAEPYLFTTTETEFPSSVYGALTKDTLEEYAYYTYLELFDDEGHYTVFYARANDGTHMWLEMAGTDTISLLDDEVFASFQENMQTKLYNSEDKGVAIADCLLIMADEAFVRTGTDIFLFVLGIVLAVGGAVGIIIGTIFSVKGAREVNDYCDYTEKGGERVKSDENAEESKDGSIDFKDYL